MPFTCRSCGASITFALTKKRHRIPLDAVPVPGGNFELKLIAGEQYAFVVEPGSAPALYRAHLPTCSGREQRRAGPTGGVHVP